MQLLRQHAAALDAAKQQINALAAELALTQQEITQLQITQWRPILAAFDQQLEVWTMPVGTVLPDPVCMFLLLLYILAVLAVSDRLAL